MNAEQFIDLWEADALNASSNPTNSLGDNAAHLEDWKASYRASTNHFTSNPHTHFKRYWSYTTPAKIASYLSAQSIETTKTAPPQKNNVKSHLSWAAHQRITFTSGPSPIIELSEPAGISTYTLSDPNIIPKLAHYFPADTTANHQPLRSLSYASMQSALLIVIAQNACISTPLHLLIQQQISQHNLQHTHVFLALESNSQLTLIEEHLTTLQQNICHNFTLSISLGTNSQLKHHKLLLNADESIRINHTAVSLHDGSDYKIHQFCTGGKLHKENLCITFKGKGAQCGIHALANTQQKTHLDQLIYIHHAQGHNSSHTNYHQLAEDNCKLSMTGVIHIAEAADQTSAHLQGKNLITSTSATVNNRPDLEINAQDVACSHGVAVAYLPPDELHFLSCRGIPPKLAEQTLLNTFLAKPIQEVNLPLLEDYLSESLLKA